MPLLSMTGYGHARRETEIGELSAEIKSVNNRFCDIKVRLPREMAAHELALVERLKAGLQRGKIDCAIRWTPAAALEPEVRVNRPMLEAYRRTITELQQDWGVDAELPWRELLNLNGAFAIQQPALDEELAGRLLGELIEAVLEPLQADRAREGRALAAALDEERGIITDRLEEVAGKSGEVVEVYRRRLDKLFESLRERLPEAVNADRFEAEILLLADKSDVTEELVRLRAHLAAFGELCRAEDESAAGKKLEFLVQEILREINTIGSKSRRAFAHVRKVSPPISPYCFNHRWA